MKHIRGLFLFLFAILFLVNCTKQTPVLNSLSPAEKVCHMPTFVLTANGSAFTAASRIVFNGIEKPTTYISDSQLSCEIQPDDIPTGPADLPVLVRTAGGTGEDSNVRNFTVKKNHTFSNMVYITNSGGVQCPNMYIDSADSIYACWDYNQENTLFSRSDDGGQTWTPAVSAANDRVSGFANSVMTMDTSGILGILMGGGPAGFYRVWFNRSDDRGDTWETVSLLSDPSHQTLGSVFDIAADENGSFFTVWRDDTDQAIRFRRSNDGGNSWTSPTSIPVVWKPGKLNLAARGNGQLFLVYSANDDAVWINSSPDSGSTWSGASVISWSGGNIYYPDMLLDSSGNFHVVFDHDGLVKYTRSTDNGLTWSTPVDVVPPSPEYADTWPQIAVDSAGNINVAIWRDFTSPDPWGIFYIRSIDNGATWSAPMGVSIASQSSKWPAIGVDSAGNVKIIWYTQDVIITWSDE